jgi:hypothetical protein
MAQGFALGFSADGASFGGKAIRILPGVAQSLTLGLAAQMAGLGSGAVGFHPLVLAAAAGQSQNQCQRQHTDDHSFFHICTSFRFFIVIIISRITTFVNQNQFPPDSDR